MSTPYYSYSKSAPNFEKRKLSKSDKNRKISESEKLSKNSKKKKSSESKKDSESSSLVYNVKSSSPSSSLSQNEKEKKKKLRFQKERGTRYRLLDIGQEILYSYGKKKGLEYPANYNQVCKCRRYMHEVAEDIKVLKNTETGRCFYSGLITCGSIWGCPICSDNIGRKRKTEIEKVFDYAYKSKNKKKLFFLTFTLVHYVKDNLKNLVKKQAEALKYLRSGKRFHEFKKNTGFDGLVRALEVTHTLSNGWHPHTHELWIVDENVDEDYFLTFIKERWKKACQKYGLLPDNRTKAFNKRGVTLESGEKGVGVDCSWYMAKQSKGNWGADAEMTMWSKKNSISAFDFLHMIDNEKLRESRGYSEKKCIRLYHELVVAMKGKAQHFWSKGLKEKCGVTDKKDEELAEEKPDRFEEIFKLFQPNFNLIVKRELRSQILRVGENDGESGIIELFNEQGFEVEECNLSRNWKRVSECSLCGESRCVVSTENPRMAYCFRHGKTYFLTNDYQNHINTPKKDKKAAQESFNFSSKEEYFLEDF